MILIVALLLALTLSGPAAADERPGAGPPLRTDDPGTPGPNRWEINTALIIEHESDRNRFETPLLDANYGVGQRLQLKAEVPWIIETQRGAPNRTALGSPLFGVKWRFLDDDRTMLQMSTYPQVTIDTSPIDKGTTLLLPIEVSKAVGKFSIGGDSGFKLISGQPGWLYGIVGGFAPTDRVQLLAETYGDSSVSLHKTTLVENIGSRIQLKDTLSLLMSVGHTLYATDAIQQWVGYLGLQITTPVAEEGSSKVVESSTEDTVLPYAQWSGSSLK